jgi:hypothetical protein
VEFTLTEEQELLRRSVRAFAESEIGPHVMRFDETLYRMLGENLVDLTAERSFVLSASTYGNRSVETSRVPGALLQELLCDAPRAAMLRTDVPRIVIDDAFASVLDALT